MRSVVVFLGGIVFAGLLYWGLDAWRREPKGGDEAALLDAGPGEQAEPGSPPAAPAPVLATRPVFFAGDAARPAAPESLPQSAAPAPASAPAGGAASLVRGTLPADEERTLARSVFDTGDRRRGARMLEELYIAQKDKLQVDLTAEVERLLEAETRPERRREYLQYLMRFDKLGRVLDDQLARAAQKAEKADDDPALAFAAWEDLTAAHEVARDAAERARVLGQVQPFLTRHIFSGRHSPLLRVHAVQGGESLFGIASKYQTTVDALRRLNGLKNDVIQPRVRLRILEGKIRLQVDKSDFRLWATVDGRLLFDLPVGIGKDNGTPARSFVVRVKQKDPSWWRPGGGVVPPGDPQNVLGSRWLGFEETQEFAGYGIHGTQDPTSVGKESSAGCIRLRNEDVELLYDFVPYGTEVIIRP